MHPFNRVEISRQALIHNFRLCQQLAGNSGIMAMVKADAYGHGMLDCAHLFAEAGVAAFGVADATEGAALREAGIKAPVFVLAGVVPQDLGLILDRGLTPVVPDAALLPVLAEQAKARGLVAGLFIKLDAGMGRQGVLPDGLADLVRVIQDCPYLRCDGMMAHFPMSDVRDSSNSAQVLAAFRGAADVLTRLLRSPCRFHLANSGGLLYVAGACFDMVRLGISLYGYYPDGEAGRAGAAPPLLRPAMRFSTRIIQVRCVPAGTGLGYNHLFVTSRPSRIAVLPVGYADGYLRVLSNRAEVLIHGRRVPVVGRISMNLTLVDVTDLDAAQAGDEVVLLGCQGKEEISADEIAAWMETISYEALCLFGKLNRRVLVD